VLADVQPKAMPSQETMPMKTINITYRNGAYYVSEPNWDGGEVVMASELDRLRTSNAQLLAACKALVDKMPNSIGYVATGSTGSLHYEYRQAIAAIQATEVKPQ